MNQYKIYRNGSTTLTERITAALQHYAAHNRDALPAAAVVNPRDVSAAGAIVNALDLPTLPVIGNGGVSVHEVWLQVAEVK